MLPDDDIAPSRAAMSFALVVEACRGAASASRALDTEIALAIFPALGELSKLEEGVWLHADGSRVRALRYTGSRAAATTLVPPGSWIEFEQGGVAVVGSAGSWSAIHREEAMAICIASLRARMASASGK